MSPDRKRGSSTGRQARPERTARAQLREATSRRTGSIGVGDARERLALTRLLRWLYDRRHGIPTAAQERLLARIRLASFAPVVDRELDALLSGERIDFEPKRNLLVLEPIAKHPAYIAAISVLHAPGQHLAETRLRLVVFYDASDAGSDSLKAVGFRFESPEGDPDHAHHLFHAQPIKQLHGIALPGSEYVLDDLPTIGIDGDGAVCMLVGLLLGLYGVSILEQLQREAALWSQLYGYVSGLLRTRSQFARAYWRVIDVSGRVSYYETALDFADFLRRVRLEEGATQSGRRKAPEIERIDYQTFIAAPTSSRREIR
jgi:hypothetical protein